LFDFTYHKPNSVSASSADAVIYLVPRLLAKSHPRCCHREYSGTSASSADSALHPGKDFAVSPPMSPSGLNYRHRMSIVVFFLSEKNVSVRTYWIAPYGYYPLPFISPTLRRRREFGLSSPDARSGETAQCKTTNIILCQTKKRKLNGICTSANWYGIISNFLN